MQGILTSGVLRAYNLGQMTDFTEGLYAASIMSAVLDRAFASAKDDNIKQLLAALRRQLTKVDLSNVFALSLTEDGDEPGMWEIYAEGGQGFGFAIPIYKALKWREEHKAMFLKCHYKPEELESFCKAALQKITDIYLGDVAAGAAPNPDVYAAMFLEDVSWFAPAFKQQIRADEKEWRYVVVRPVAEHKHTDDGRAYIELPLQPTPQFPHPIEAICAGPNCDYDDTIRPLQRLLFEKGHGANYPVHLSKHFAARAGRQSPPLNYPAPISAVANLLNSKLN